MRALLSENDLRTLQDRILRTIEKQRWSGARRFVAWRLIKQLTYLMWLTSRKSISAAWYCTPSQAYLADTLKTTDRTIRTTLTALKQAGYLTTKRRRKPHGYGQTTLLYLPGAQLAAITKNVQKLSTGKSRARRGSTR